MIHLNNTTWGFFSIAFTSLLLGLFVYIKNRGGSLNKAWGLLSLATAVWALGTASVLCSSEIDSALLWARIAQAAFSLIPIFFLRFILIFVQGSFYPHWLFQWNIRISWIFSLFSLTPFMISDVQTDLPFPFYPEAGPLYGIFSIWLIAIFLSALAVLLKAYRVQIGFRRNQIRYLILATLVGLLSYISMIPSFFGIPVQPIGQGLLLFYALITYTIIRWRLMDISIVLKNTLIYANLYSVLVGLFVVVVVVLGQLFFYGPQTLDRRVLWMCAVALSIVTLVVRPLDAWLSRMTDRILFQQKYDWQKTLKEASKGMTKITSLDRLLKLMSHFIGLRMRVSYVAIYYRINNEYLLKVSRGKEKPLESPTLDRGNPLICWLEEKKEGLVTTEIHRWLQHEKLFPHQPVLRPMLEDILMLMERMGAHACVPAFSRDKMLGFLILGEKLSERFYSQEDLDVLSTLASEGAIAIENAQLYEQLYQRMAQIENLYEREHKLFIHTAIALASAVDARDPYTHGHTERCAAYAMVITEEMSLMPEIETTSRFKETLRISALLHDIGKIGIPDDILGKKGKLTPREYKKMQEHPLVGAIILQPIKGMEEVARALKAHHERYDGNGYPDGLRGTEIPLMGRIVAVADAFDTMTADRPYRKRLSEIEAVQEIEKCSGTQFDPVVVEAFLKVHRKGLIVNRPVEATEMLG